ncbi:MAG TPA: methylenetetrahydrofolate--tRNA-(uracil(54)-C(5))-methyltransferase (FADH(2)-oxidizing) TrmFO [Syntrophales bacterium]|nr:methylenetetrahydrofolate--tRNA-(uracil(54)-C(5))-methyltransferase (FADH(2)-oxidizing) TrmFO [Syntrophales bacterium]
MKDHVIIIGGGLAGCEAAWQLLRRETAVTLYEMKPGKYSPAHRSPLLAELVCSNSLRSNTVEDAPGLLKEELRLLGSLIMKAADENTVPAGKALAVDRLLFSEAVENKLAVMEGLKIARQEGKEIPGDSWTIIASGPLTSDSLSAGLEALLGRGHLSFYDAISPIVDAGSIDHGKVFRASRYGRGSADYLNCPLDREQYENFWNAVRGARETPLLDFEDPKFFESCLPIEVMAARGRDTLLHGPMKPVGLVDPATGRQPYAVVQLRPENREMTFYNMVGFQTKLARPEQERVLRMIPGLEKAEFLRYGSIHRNTFVNAPAVLLDTLQIKGQPKVLLAGQITGVEGYVESTAMGLLAGINISFLVHGRVPPRPPRETALGSLVEYLVSADPARFQPMNVNFGLLPPLPGKVPRRLRGQARADRALAAIREWAALIGPGK